MYPEIPSINKSRQVLLIPNDFIKPNMTGPAIRYWELAHVLHRYFSVTMALPPLVCPGSQPEALEPPFEVILCHHQADLKAAARTTDVIITLGVNLSIYPFLLKMGKPIVVDMYIPFMLEGLQKYEASPSHERSLALAGHRGAHTVQIRSADFIICASQKQKDFWLGWLSALGRVNPYVHQQDPTLSSLIEVVPFGLPQQKPIHDKQVLKGVYKTIGPNDKVILWGGGIWSWLDPQTLIKAMALLAENQPTIKLFFMGIKSPNPNSARMGTADQAIRLSQALGLYDRTVFFNDWVPYQERHNYLLEADIGASLHLNHLETRFSFRTRLLDYFWTSLPILATEGDVLSDEIRQWQLGRIVPGADVAAVSQAILDLLEVADSRQPYRSRFEQVQAKYAWDVIAQPLVRFCHAPYFAADKSYLKHIPLAESGLTPWWHLPAKLGRTLWTHGARQLTHKMVEYLRWRWGK